MAMNVNIIETSLNSNSKGLQGNFLFVFSLIFMLIVEMVWIIVDAHLRNETIIPYKWTYVNLFTILFLFWFLIHFGNTSLKVIDNQTIITYVIAHFSLLFILSLRTVVNYLIGWDSVYVKGFEVRASG